MLDNYVRCVHTRLFGVWLGLRYERPIDTPFAPNSGGSWITGSLYMNDFPTIKDLVYGDGNNTQGWLLNLPLATPDGDNVFSEYNQKWYGSILWSIYAKAGTGM